MTARSRGFIELVCGPMFSGKSTTLLNRINGARQNGQVVALFKPESDQRYSASEVMTHDGVRHLAVNVRNSAAILPHAASVQAVGIDEAHFFESDLADHCSALAGDGKKVFLAGVDIDHLGKVFEVMDRLIAVADQVTRLVATCKKCGGVARFTQRLSNDQSRIVIGGSEMYEPRCEKCFLT